MRRFILPSNRVGQSGIIQSGNDNRNVQLTVIQNAARRSNEGSNYNAQRDIAQSGIGNMNFQNNIGQSLKDLPIVSNLRTLPSIPILTDLSGPIIQNFPFISSFS